MKNVLKYGIAALAVTFAMIPVTAYADHSFSDALISDTITEQCLEVKQSDGWVTNDNGTRSYYQDGKKVIREMIKIDGAYYYFNDSGIMLDEAVTSIIIDEVAYYIRAKKGGKLYCNEWYKTDYYNYYYYYDEGCKAASGYKNVDGKNYYFNYDGSMAVNSTVIDETGLYVVDYYGIATKLKDKWNKVGDFWYYVKDEDIVVNEIIEIDGAYYYFGRSGRMEAGSTFGANSGDTYGYVRAKADGKLYRNEWYRDYNGVWYYYGNNFIRYEGLKRIDGKLYYFAMGGLMESDSVIISSNRLIYCNESGVAKILPNGWHYLKDEWYYVRDGHAVTGFTEIDGKNYYFEYSGKMKKRTTYMDEEKKELYIIDSDGLATKVTKKGWIYYGTEWYYIEDDGRYATGLVEIGSDWYYFYYGLCMTDSMVPIGDKCYYFDDNGKMVTDKWIHRNNSRYYYATKSGELATGDMKISGKWYTFDEYGCMLTGIVKSYDERIYYYNPDGTYWGEIKGTGWNKKNGSWYYITEEGMYKDNIYEFPDGNKYVFDASGRMLSSQFLAINVSNPKGGYRRVKLYLDESGKAVGGWFKKNDKWYYADPETKELARDFTTIDGKVYFFDYSGTMFTGKLSYGNSYYYFDDNGVLVDKVIYNGWVYLNGYAYYYKAGVAYTGWVGDYYVYEGSLARQMIVTSGGSRYLVDEFGKWVKKPGWYSFDNLSYVYINSSGKVVTNQWIKDNGKWYYAGAKGYIYINEAKSINGKYELFDENGAWLGTLRSNTKTGWVEKEGKWFYFKYGYLLSGRQCIGGKWYYFDDNYEMLSDIIVENIYYGKDGAQQKYTGWKKINGYWCYFSSKYAMVSGWLNEGGKNYYLAEKYVEGLGTIYTTITNKKISLAGDTIAYAYTFDNDGKLIKTETIVSGWVKMNSNGKEKWAYVRGAVFVTGLTQINGKIYLFDTKGAMCSSETYLWDGYYRFCDKNGVVVSKEGWYKNAEGKDVYVNQNGYAVNGVIKWNGKYYISYV